MGRAMNAWSAFKWTVRSALLDKGAVLPIVAGVVVYCFFYPLPYLNETVQKVPVVVADYDGSSISRAIERDLDATQSVRVQGTAARVEDALPLLQRGEIGGIVAVPPNFYRDVLRGRPTGVTVMGNGGYIVVDGTVLETTAKVVAEATAPTLAGQLVRAKVPPAAVLRAAHAGPLFVKQPLFNTVQGYDSYVVPASMGLIVHQLLVIGMCVVMGTWIEGGRWAIAPLGRLGAGAFVGMVAGFWVLVMAAILLWIGFAFWYHDLPRAGNMGGALGFAGLYALAVVGVGIALGCWMGERERALQIIGGISIPLLFLSGFAFPVESIDPSLEFLSQLLPTTPGIQGFLKLNQMGATWSDVQPQVINLMILGALYIGTAWWAASHRARQASLQGVET
jgi:ABC-2 type transport system permease protein